MTKFFIYKDFLWFYCQLYIIYFVLNDKSHLEILITNLFYLNISLFYTVINYKTLNSQINYTMLEK